MHEADDDVVTDVDFTTMISEEEKEELKIELVKVMNLNCCECYCFYIIKMEDTNCRMKYTS